MIGRSLELIGRTASVRAPDTFTRIEDKFFIPRERSAELIATIEERLEPAYPGSGTQFNPIESLYFDSDRLDMYRAHFESPGRRFKLRIRRYATNGVWNDESVHLELKMKEDGVSRKVRFRIGPMECSLLSLGHRIPLSLELARRNPHHGAKALRKRTAKVNEMIERYQLRPKTRVTYLRRAYEREGLRVTIDDQIRCQLLDPVDPRTASHLSTSEAGRKAGEMRRRFLQSDFLVLEVKHPGLIPEWVSELLRRIGTARTSFSKYCFTLSEHLQSGEPAR